MKRWINVKSWKYRSVMLVVTAAAIGGLLFFAFGQPTPAQAHCDSVQGPVVTAARQALETGDVNLVLPYVKPEAEAELTAAFNQALKVRGLSSEAQELADEYFFEVAVRLHREGEGAAYTGLKDERVPDSIRIADEAMATGDLTKVKAYLGEAIDHGIDEKYEALTEARHLAEKEGTVEAHRERVEAELMFETYVYELYTLISGQGPHGEAEPAH